MRFIIKGYNSKVMPTTYQIASDLHIEYMSTNIDPLSLITPVADILILAGDIGNLYKYDQLFNFLNGLVDYFKYILYVPGNHEYYKPKDARYKNKTFSELNHRLDSLASSFTNLVVLNCASVLIGNTCIVGCTLWSDIKCDLPRYIVRINDFNTIFYKSLYLHHADYISRMIGYCKEHKYEMVCVTHHPPTFDVINMVNRKQKFTSLYASSLDDIINKDNMSMWVFGHVHKNFDLDKNGCRLISNQLGREKDNVQDYKTDLSIEI